MEFYPAILTDQKEEYTYLLTELASVSQKIHVDFADQTLVANTTLLPEELPTVAGTASELHAHLMVTEPSQYFESLRSHGFHTAVIHLECQERQESIIARAKASHLKIALALNPESDILAARSYLDDIDYLQIMGVYPGFTNQDFLETTYGRIQKVKALWPNIPIAVDGGVRRHNLEALAKAGATIFVASKQGYAENGEIASSVREWNRLMTDLAKESS